MVVLPNYNRYKEQLARVEREKEELRNYKEDEVASFKVALVHHR